MSRPPCYTQRKTKGQQLKGKIVSALFHTFFALIHTLFFFSSPLPLKIKPFLKRIKENKNKKTKPFCTLVVARLSSSNLQYLWVTPLFGFCFWRSVNLGGGSSPPETHGVWLGKKKTNKHKEFWLLHINQAQMSQVSWDVPSLSLGRLRAIPTAKFLCVIFLIGFFSPKWGP